MKTTHIHRLVLIAALGAVSLAAQSVTPSPTTTAPTSSAPVSAADIQALQDQIQQLSQRLSILQRNSEIQTEAQAAAAQKAPVVTADQNGFSISSADKAFSLQFHGLVQTDARYFFKSNNSAIGTDSIFLRRVRPIITGTLGSIFDFAIVPEFGTQPSTGTTAAPSTTPTSTAASTATLVDAWLAARIDPAFTLRAGRFTSPVAFNPGDDRYFLEAPFVNTLAPNRDYGFEAFGSLDKDLFLYRGGVYNGARNNTTTLSSDADDDKTFAGRITVQPYKTADSVLGLGVGASLGHERGSTSSAVAQNLVSNGQQTIFSYPAGLVGDGSKLHTRIDPNIYFYSGPFSIVGTYAIDDQSFYGSAAKTHSFTATNTAWSVETGYVLTGENSTAKGVTPSSPFSWKNGTWGAFELVARVSGLDIDDDFFTPVAQGGGGVSRSTNADGAIAFGAGVNWFLNSNVLVRFDFEHTKFDNSGASSTSYIAHDENLISTRLQLSF